MMDKHQQRMQIKKAIHQQKLDKAQEERGVVILLKGNGKGKSSSALGTMARALGHGHRCAVIQFIKGKKATGEYLFFKDHSNVDWHVMGHGFTWETQDKNKDRIAAQEAFTMAKRYLSDEQYDLLVFDEMGYMFKYGHIEVAPLIEALAKRPKKQNVIITGRTMAVGLQEVADTISIVQDEKHAYRIGVKAQAGIEY